MWNNGGTASLPGFRRPHDDPRASSCWWLTAACFGSMKMCEASASFQCNYAVFTFSIRSQSEVGKESVNDQHELSLHVTKFEVSASGCLGGSNGVSSADHGYNVVIYR